METHVDEIADHIYRLSTFVPDVGPTGFTFNQFLIDADEPAIFHTALGCMVSINDLAHRPPAPINPDNSYDLGGRSVRSIDTPHVPHGWDAHVLYEETTGTLFCGDLFSQVGAGPAITTNDLLDAAAQAEDIFSATCLTPQTAPTIRRLAELEPTTLAIMHGSSYNGEASKALLSLADDYDRRLANAG